MQSVVWGAGCACWIANVITPTKDRVDLRVNLPEIVRVDHDVIAIGRVDPEYPTLVNVDWLRAINTIDLRPLSLVSSLHKNRELSVVLLVVLAVFGWQAVALAQSALVSATSVIAAVLILNLAAIRAGVGLPDVSWALTLMVSACLGWRLTNTAETLFEAIYVR